MRSVVLLLALAALAAAAPPQPAVPKASAAAAPPTSITLSNKQITVELTPIGASIHKLLVPRCKGGEPVDVALGYKDVANYAMDPHPSFGAIVGRVGNRISNARFTLDGKNYSLLANEGSSSIHGGAVRWSKQVWAASKAADGLSATFTYNSPDGEAGFPGAVKATVVYSIPPSGTWLNISISATVDKATPLNILGHNYFNLKGEGNGDILDHVVEIPSLYFTPSPPGDLLPTGQVFAVEGTAYDLRAPAPVRRRHLQANGGPYKGYDLNYVMNEPAGSPEPVWWLPGQNPQVAPGAATSPLKLGAVVTEPTSGLRLRVYTNAPGIHWYSGNFLNGQAGMPGPSKSGVYYDQYQGFCLETQAFPNAVNTPTFPSPIVRPGETFSNRVSYDFACS